MEQIKSFLETIKLARKQTHENLILFPLLAPEIGLPDYLTLEQALERQAVRITEVDQDGSVPELRLINQGTSRILIIEGEEVVGAKQNRIVNISFLVPGKTDLNIPVSCVEQGRWGYRSREFSHGKKVSHASLRRAHQDGVKESLRRRRGYQSDQGQIWENIAAKSARMAAPSPTGAMADLFDSYEDRLVEYTRRFRLVECQVGAVFAVNGQILGLEIFGFQDTFTRFFGKLVKSYALDAIDWMGERSKENVPPETVRRFLRSLRTCKTEEHPSIGLGAVIQLESPGVSGTALFHEFNVLHLSAFKKENSRALSRVGYQRSSMRRRLRD